MLSIERNAPGIDDQYLDALSTCFPGAWSPARYRWYLKRPFRSRHPDTLTAHDGGTVVAGLCVNYRRLRAAGNAFDVGILTAGWTLPKYRRRGCYSRLLDEAVRVASHNGCTALLGFATAANASGTALKRIGAEEVPTRYLSLAPDDRFVPPPSRPTLHELPPRAPAALLGAEADIAFHYATADEWAGQFVHRPDRTTMLEVDGRLAVVEHADATLRLQFLSERDPDGTVVAALAAHAREQGRHFFYFTTDIRLAESAAGYGLWQTTGRILVLGLHSAASWTSSRWCVEPGDRM